MRGQMKVVVPERVPRSMLWELMALWGSSTGGAQKRGATACLVSQADDLPARLGQGQHLPF